MQDHFGMLISVLNQGNAWNTGLESSQLHTATLFTNYMTFILNYAEFLKSFRKVSKTIFDHDDPTFLQCLKVAELFCKSRNLKNTLIFSVLLIYFIAKKTFEVQKWFDLAPSMDFS